MNSGSAFGESGPEMIDMAKSEAPFERWPIVGGVVAGPGDTLVIAMESGRTMQELEELREEIRRYISGGIRVAVIEGSTGLAVARSEPDAAPTVVECPNAGCEHFRKPVEIRPRRWGNAVEYVAPTCDCGWAMWSSRGRKEACAEQVANPSPPAETAG